MCSIISPLFYRSAIKIVFSIFLLINQKRKKNVMKENQQKIDESDYCENESAVMAKEKSLILLETKPEKNLDQTISTPDLYLSRYQYNTRNIDKYLTLCPHCKKPTLSAFEKSAIDSAIDYLNGKRMFNHYPASGRSLLPIITFLLATGTALYFLLNHIVATIRA